jgi:ABC-type polysaccharide/polyol phosphate transport system ATPase subunit
MPKGDVVVEGLWKTFRVYHQRSSTLKQAILHRGKEDYEEFWALRDVSFQVPAGTTFGLIGANGAGKSTMLKVLSRILVPDKGSVAINGRVSALLELGSGFHPELSGRENVFLNGTILGMSQGEITRRFDEIVGFAGLEHAIDNAVKTYSSGMQARLGFAVAVSIEPDILIVDEVLSVGDEQFQRRSLERMAELRSGGRTCIFVSHGLAQVQQICESAVWLDKGQVAATGDTEEVINAYLRSISGDIRIDARGHQHQGGGEVLLDVDVIVGDEPREVLATGEAVTIALGWTCTEHVDDIRVTFAIHSAEGVVVAGAVIQAPHVESLWPGSGMFEYRIPNLQLLPGSYHISAEVVNRHSGRIYDSGPNLAAFDVVPGPAMFESLGYVALNGVWGGKVHA